ncbi:MAG TPA: hypothetical protein PKD64_04235 [Pirellulaceae bacterium]|nr:hypothetical protein [Pirellulaceae bacterium]HMO91381.1 hypothetical protein [Pirellulaceae bacterium]HMP69606.1 hypothetical protein [Pirellulaceae bacterium]
MAKWLALYLFALSVLCVATSSVLVAQGVESSKSRFLLRLKEIATPPLDGRLLLMFSTDGSNEPRFQITDNFRSQQVFGIDVENWDGGEYAIDASAFGYPQRSLEEIRRGRYFVQAFFHEYETFHRSDGHIVKLPMDRGEGQVWNKAPGNRYSIPVEIEFDPHTEVRQTIVLDQVIPPIEPPADTDYIKHIRIQSELLSEFWGRPMYLGAHVLLPEGFEENPDARYPLAIFHGHFSHDFGGFRTEPPDPDLEPDYSERFRLAGYNRIIQQEAYDFYKIWTGPDFPRMLVVEIQHANPYYDDSYAVNSANIGPYGDAITYELIPEIERRFRGIGQGWARCLYGGSTGGWEALAAQVFYPDEYNACYAACPDPIDFRQYTVVNIYEDENAYFQFGPFGYVARPGRRNYLGHIDATLENMNHYELALGTKGRSGQQWDVWQAVYSPVGADGYPQPIWDKFTGKIDHEVASHWRENFDLVHIMRRDWRALGPKLAGKIHIYCGDMDNYYLNNAVYLAEEFLVTAEPPYGGEITYGDRAEHCWNGDPTQPNAISRLRYHRMFVPRFAERILKSAPEGADTTSWRY